MAKINLKIVVFTLLVFSLCGIAKAQSFNEDKTAFSNFLKRMYTAKPFEGVKIVDDYDHQYLISVNSLEIIIKKINFIKDEKTTIAFNSGIYN